MKIWHEIPLYVPPSEVPGGYKSPGQSPHGLMFTAQVPAFTRKHKIEEISRQLVSHVTNPHRSPDIPLGLRIIGKAQKAHSVMLACLSDQQSRDRLSYIIRDASAQEPHDESDESSDPFSAYTALYLGDDIDPHQYESLFYSFRRQGYAGIAMDVEKIQRSIVTLAQRFDLQSVITGVRHPRQEEIALRSGANAVITSIY